MQPIPKKVAPTKASLQKLAIQGAKPAAKAKAPVVSLSPEELKQQQAKEVTLRTKANEWQKDPKLTAKEKELGLYTVDKYGNAHKDPDLINRESTDLAVRDVVQLCKNKPKSKLITVQCVPGVRSTRVKTSKDVIAYTLADQQAARGEDLKLKVDYNKVVDWEGGCYTQGYIPWGLQLRVLEENVGTQEKAVSRQTVAVITTRRNLEGKSVLQGDKAGGRSGVTIGVGVDIGQQSDDGHREQLQKATMYSKEKRFGYDSAKATALSNKLKPYMSLKLTDACAKLIKVPLTLTSEEVEFMTYQAFMAHTNAAIDGYKYATHKNWSDLGAEEQTAILGYVYQTGSMPPSLYKAFGNYNKEQVLAAYKGRREYGYIKKFYDNDTDSERAKAHEAARGQKQPATQPTAKPAATKTAKPAPTATTTSPVVAPASTQPKARIQLGTTTVAPVATATTAPASPKAAAATTTTPAGPPAPNRPTAPATTTDTTTTTAPTHQHSYQQNEYREQIRNHDQRGKVVPPSTAPAPTAAPDSTHAAGAVAPLTSRTATLQARIQYPAAPRQLPTTAAPAAAASSRYPPPPATTRSSPTSNHPKANASPGSAPAATRPAAAGGAARLQYPVATAQPAAASPAQPGPKTKHMPPAHPAREHLSRGAMQRELKPVGSPE